MVGLLRLQHRLGIPREIGLRAKKKKWLGDYDYNIDWGFQKIGLRAKKKKWLGDHDHDHDYYHLLSRL